MSVTPEASKTVSLTSQPKAAQGPTPKNEFKVPMYHRNHFNSPTDAMVSPCTQKLMQSRRMPRKIAPGSQKPRQMQSYNAHKASSGLANKENRMTFPAKETCPAKEMFPAKETFPAKEIPQEIPQKTEEAPQKKVEASQEAPLKARDSESK